METEARVARGAAALYLASITTLILNTGYFVVLTNYIHVDEVGLVSLLNVVVIGTTTLATLALPIVGAGISATPPAVTRFLSQYLHTGVGSARKVYLLSLGVCALISSSITLLLSTPSVSARLAAPMSRTPVFFASLDALASSFSQLGVYSLIGAGRAPLAGKLMVASSALRYAAASLLLITGYSVSGVFIGFSIGDAALAIVTNFASSKLVTAAKDGPFSLKPVLTYMASVMVAAFIGFGVTQVDKLLAFFQQGLGNLGVYNVATVGAAVASFAPSAVTNVLVPILGSIPSDALEQRRELMKNYTRYIILIAAPMGLGLAAVSPFLLRLFGDEYVAGAPLLAIMATSVAFTSISSVYSSDLLVGEKTYLFSLGNVIGLATLLAVALGLVPYFGLVGVALGRGGMLGTSLLAFALLVRRRGDLVLDSFAYAKSGAASLLMGVIVYSVLDVTATFLLRGRGAVVLSAVVMIPVGFALYLYLMKLLEGFDANDLEFLKALLPRRMRWVLEFAKRFL